MMQVAARHMDHSLIKQVLASCGGGPLCHNQATGTATIDGGRSCWNLIGRGERIRTSDLTVPNRALYQAEPRPDK